LAWLSPANASFRFWAVLEPFKLAMGVSFAVGRSFFAAEKTPCRTGCQ
jgi:hypothetical protein